MSPDISEETLREFEQLAILQEALGDQYEMTLIEKGVNKGKVKLTPNRIHGQSNSLNTINGLLMEAQVQRTGKPVFERNRPGLTNQSKKVRMAAEALLSPGAASYLASVGLREGDVNSLPATERLARAKVRVDELDKGYDMSSAALLENVGLDGGHIAAHSTNPELSTSAENMKFENQYVNRVKGNSEGEATVSRIRNSLKRRLKQGDANVIRQIAGGWQP